MSSKVTAKVLKEGVLVTWTKGGRRAQVRTSRTVYGSKRELVEMIEYLDPRHPRSEFTAELPGLVEN